MKRAIVTGITGQDGSYLAELLLGKNYEVHGFVRRSSNITRPRLDHLTSDVELYNQRLFLHYSDLEDMTTTRRLILGIQPDEIFHLAGQSHVGASFDIPESTCEFIAMGTLRLLEIIRDCPKRPKLLHIGSSEIFGMPTQSPQSETTAFNPITPYGVAKAFAVQMVRVYRESFGFFACNAICFNHESPRRGEAFVTRKITRAAARIKLGLEKGLSLGNVEGQRDWGFAPDYVDAFWRMLQIDKPTDLVLATGKLHRVRDWLDIAFAHVGLDWRQLIKVDDRLVRKADPATLLGDSSLARKLLDWQPSTDFEKMVRQMVDADLAIARESMQSAPKNC